MTFTNKSTNHKNFFIKLSAFILFILVFSLSFTDKGFAEFGSSDLKITSESAVVIDAETGTLLYAHNKDKRIYPASTTKVLSALVALEKGKKNQKITVSENALEGQKDRGTHIGLDKDDVISLEDALYGMILESANDAAIAVGENIGGSLSEFSNLMNQKAKSLGMKNSNFTNPHGWYDKNHYTTAYDMALATKAAYENSDLRKILSATKHTISSIKGKDSFDIYPTHKMFPYKSFYYEHFWGGKPGYLEESRGNLISIAKNSKMTLIAYVAKNSVSGTYEDTKNLFDFTFKNYEKVKLSADGKNNNFNSLIKKSNYKIRTVGKEIKDVHALLPKQFNKSELQFEIENIDNKYPIKKGDTIAYAVVKYRGEIASKTPITAVDSLSKFSYFIYIFLKIIKILIPILLLIFCAFVIFLRFGNKKRRIHKIITRKIHKL